jgi:hypothetical protein
MKVGVAKVGIGQPGAIERRLTKECPRGLRRLPQRRPQHTCHERGVRSLESYVHRKVPAWFGGGVHGKGSPRLGKQLAARPILYKALRHYRGCPWLLGDIVEGRVGAAAPREPPHHLINNG